MASLQGFLARLRGDRVDTIAREVAEVHDRMLAMNHMMVHEANSVADAMTVTSSTLETINDSVARLIESVARLIESTELQRGVLLELNHDVRSGADASLPLFLGYAERLRLDTDTAIGAAQVIERQLSVLESLIAPSEQAEPT
jgi:hypothetical protein